MLSVILVVFNKALVFTELYCNHSTARAILRCGTGKGREGKGRAGQGRAAQDSSARAWHNSKCSDANINTLYNHNCTAVMSNSVNTLSDLSSESDEISEMSEQTLL